MEDYVVSVPQQQQAHAILYRRSFDSATHHISGDLELLSIRPSFKIYTSLRDLLPAVPINSPSPRPGSDICIRNRLVKLAAWAYLQPMPTSPGSAGDSLFHRLWPRVAAFIDLVRRSVASAVDWTLRIPIFQGVV